LIVALGTRFLKELTIGFVTLRLMYKVSRMKEYNNVTMDNTAMVANNAKGGEGSQI
jgi:hypothetical protein